MTMLTDKEYEMLAIAYDGTFVKRTKVVNGVAITTKMIWMKQ